MKKISILLFLVSILLLSSCAKKTVSRLKPYDSYSKSEFTVIINHKESLKFKNYKKEDFKIPGIKKIYEVTDMLFKDYYMNDFSDFYESQTMDNFKRRFIIQLEQEPENIYDVCNQLLKSCSFVESAYVGSGSDKIPGTVYSLNTMTITLTHKESVKFKEYTKEDFFLEDIAEMTELNRRAVDEYKKIYEEQGDISLKFVRHFTIVMNYSDEERLKSDAIRIYNECGFIRDVYILDDDKRTPQPLSLVFRLTNEESLKFKRYTKEDFKFSYLYDYIYDVVDMTYVYEEIINSNNKYFDSSSYQKVIYVKTTIREEDSFTYLLYQTRTEASHIDFIDNCEMYGTYSWYRLLDHQT